MTVAEATLTEHEAVAAFLSARDEESFSALAGFLTPKLLRYFEVRGCDAHTAEELTQDVLLACYRHAATIRNSEAFTGWLYRVARNVLLQGVRKWKRRISTVSLDGVYPDVRIMSAPRFGDTRLSDLFACLDAGEQELIALRYVDGYNYEEIGAMLNIPAGTAKWRVFNCKIKMLAQAGKCAKRGK